MNSKENAASRTWIGRFIGVVLILAISFATASTAAAQKKKKNDDSQSTPPPSTAPAGSEEAKVDNVIGEFLGAWQLGDIATMHKAVADDVSVVAGTWTPPAVGWTNYLTAYQQQRARMQQVRMERSDTLIRIAASGQFAWACYQWNFSALVDGAPMAAVGQTTLILEKKNDTWLIVHNHTSLVQASQPSSPASAAPQAAQPTKP
jgi:ketosteroid isomerase-like protein